MDQHDQRIVLRVEFDCATRPQSFGVAAGENEFAEPLQRNQRQDDRGESHAACRSATQLAVKPGPSAVNSERGGRPCARARSSTKRTVGPDMLP